MVEVYKDDRGNADSICANQPSSEKRDAWLTSLTKAWIDDLSYEHGIKGSLIPVVSLNKRTLTHWRVLTITCGKKDSLSILMEDLLMNGTSEDNLTVNDLM